MFSTGSELIIFKSQVDLPASILIPENQIFDLESYTQKILFDFFKNFEGINYWVTGSHSYIKKTNLLEDSAQWEGWFVQLDLESAKPIDVKDVIHKISSWNQSEVHDNPNKRSNQRRRRSDNSHMNS